MQTPDKPDDPLSVIAAALHGVMQAVGYVEKTGENEFHHYSYASEADYLDKLRPEMVKQGLMLIPSGRRISDIDSHGNIFVEIEYTLLHKSGAVWPEKIVAFGAGNDKARSGPVGDKGLYKALTGANKYLLGKLFQISTGDDPEVHTPGQYGEAQREDRGEGERAPAPQSEAGPPLMSWREQEAALEELKARLGGLKSADKVQAEMTGKRTLDMLARCSEKIRTAARDAGADRYRALRKADTSGDELPT